MIVVFGRTIPAYRREELGSGINCDRPGSLSRFSGDGRTTYNLESYIFFGNLYLLGLPCRIYP